MCKNCLKVVTTENLETKVCKHCGEGLIIKSNMAKVLYLKDYVN